MRERGLCAFATGHAWVMLRDEEVELAGGDSSYGRPLGRGLLDAKTAARKGTEKMN